MPGFCRANEGARDIDDGLNVDADVGGDVAAVVANLAAMGGSSVRAVRLDGAGEGVDIDLEGCAKVEDTIKGVGIGGITSSGFVGFDFRRKNEDEVFFFNLGDSDGKPADVDGDFLVFFEDVKDGASDRYAPSLAASVSYSVASPGESPFDLEFDLSLSFFSFLLLLF